MDELNRSDDCDDEPPWNGMTDTQIAKTTAHYLLDTGRVTDYAALPTTRVASRLGYDHVERLNEALREGPWLTTKYGLLRTSRVAGELRVWLQPQHARAALGQRYHCGEQIGNLTVIAEVDSVGHARKRRRRYLVQRVCGCRFEVNSANLKERSQLVCTTCKNKPDPALQPLFKAPTARKERRHGRRP